MLPDDDAQRAAIKTQLDAARRAREQGRLDDREQALTEAAALAQDLTDGTLLATACWRLAKARHDTGRPGVDTALAPLLERTREPRGLWGIKHAVTPFTHYPKGLTALPTIVAHHGDRHGYGSPTLHALLQAAAEEHAALGDPFPAAQARQLLAWSLACSGELEAVRALHDEAQRLDPKRFGDGPHRHPAAPDTPTSVFWVQRDLARTLLRAATWAPDPAQHERTAWMAHDALEEAMEDTGADRRRDPWYLEATLHAALRFGWREPRAQLTPLLAQADLSALPAAHTGRMAALLALLKGQDPLPHFQAAARAARAPGVFPGPEWTVLALLGHDQREAAQAEGDRTSVRIAADIYVQP